MRLLNCFACAVLLGLLGLHMDRPDAGIWIFAFGVGAAWTALAAAFPFLMTLKPVTMLLSLSTAGAILGTVVVWPKGVPVWEPATFVTSTEAQTAFGMVVLTVALFGPILTSIRKGREKREAEQAKKEEALSMRTRAKLAEAGRLDASW